MLFNIEDMKRKQSQELKDKEIKEMQLALEVEKGF
jgi:hypothetical protein